MNKRIMSFVIMITAVVLVDIIFYQLRVHLGSKQLFFVSDFLIKSILVFVLIENLIYNKIFNLKSSGFKIILFTVVPLVVSMHIADRLQTIENFYFFSKRSARRVTDGLWQFDKNLGHKAVPNSKGSYVYYIKPNIKGDIPVVFDSSGHRTVPDPLKLKSETLDLYLGCSLTFGEYIESQNGYPHLTSKLLEHSYINAGASAYGYAQMIQKLEDLVKKHQFKYIFIQLSPWLPVRAMRLNGPTFYGYRPFPYFSDDGSGFALNPPAYSTLMYQKRNWRDNKRTYFEKILFSFSEGIKIELCDYYSYQYAKLKTSLGFIPKPTKRKADLEKFFCDHVIKVCAKNNSTPIFLKLEYPSDECLDLMKHIGNKAQIIDLDIDLENKINETGLTFEQLFAIRHITDGDSIIFEPHPNNFANELFSKRIYNDLKKGE